MPDRVINDASVTITVSSIKQVEPGKKMGAVYDANRERWGVWGDQLPNYTEGGVYKITSYKEGEFQGKTLRTIVKSEYIGAPPRTRTPAPSHTSPTPNRSDYDARDAAKALAANDARDRQMQRNIFVCGAINNILSNPAYVETAGFLDQQELTKLTRRLMLVWENSLGSRIDLTKPPANEDLNDELPEW